MMAAVNALDVVESGGWVPVSEGLLPEDGRTVIAWNFEAAMPCTALYDEEEAGWYEQANGAKLPDGAVTHWRHYVGPARESSGGNPKSPPRPPCIPAQAPPDEPAPVAEDLITPEIMRTKGVASATDWFDTDDGVDPAANLEFRVWCRDDLVLFYGDRADFKDLMIAWDEGFDSVPRLGPTPSEIGLRRAYLLSDDRGRQSIYNYAVSMAEDWPRETLSEVCQIAEGAA